WEKTESYRDSATLTPEISIVLPALDEADALPALIYGIAETLAGESFEIIIVDDGSRDTTWTVINYLRNTYRQVRGLRLAPPFAPPHAARSADAVSRGVSAIRGGCSRVCARRGAGPSSRWIPTDSTRRSCCPRSSVAGATARSSCKPFGTQTRKAR